MRKLMLLSMCAITSLCLVACSGENTSNEAQNTTVSNSTTLTNAQTQKETTTKASKKEESTITLTIPADFIGESTQEDLDNTAKEYGYKAVLNADGSATYTMTESQHAEMMEDLSNGLKTTLNEMVGSEDYPNFTNIEVNSDFTKFTITTKSEELDLNESISVMGFYIYSGMYHVFNGTEAGNVTIEFINADSGKVIYSSDSEEAGKATTEAEQMTPSEISIAQAEIFNQDGVIITVTGIDMDGILGPEIKVLVENNSAQNLTVQIRNSSINDYMSELQMSCDVASGKKANDGIAISTSDLEACGIDTITEVEFSFHIFNSDSWDDFVDSEQIVLTTSAAEEYSQVYDASGDILYEDNGLKIVAKELRTDSSLFGPELVLYFENTSDKHLTIQSRDTSVNGFMIDPIMSVEIAPGKHAIDGLTFMSSKLEENSISEITDIETAFHIFYTDNWDTVADTEPITISFK